MSFLESGLHILPTGDTFLTYSNHLLSRKQSEGRMMVYDTCSDYRAWSPNVLEYTKYLQEQAAKPGRIIPREVLIDYTVGISTNELKSVKEELQKFKALELTREQKLMLQSDIGHDEVNEENTEYKIKKKPVQKYQQDVSLQVDTAHFTKEFAVNTDMDIASHKYDYRKEKRYSNRYNSLSLQTNCESISEYDTEFSSDSGSESEKEKYKDVIIEKDAEIMSLTVELEGKEQELEELKDLNEKLEMSLKEAECNINMLQEKAKASQDKFTEMKMRQNQEIQELIHTLRSYQYEISKLKDDLENQTEICHEQVREIKQLRYFLKEQAQEASFEKDTLTRQLQEERRNAEEMTSILERLEDFRLEAEKLRKQNYEKSAVIDDQEKEIEKLIQLVQELSKNELKNQTIIHKMSEEIEELKVDLDRKSLVLDHEKYTTLMHRDDTNSVEIKEISDAWLEKNIEHLRYSLQTSVNKQSRQSDDNEFKTNLRMEVIQKDILDNEKHTTETENQIDIKDKEVQDGEDTITNLDENLKKNEKTVVQTEIQLDHVEGIQGSYSFGDYTRDGDVKIIESQDILKQTNINVDNFKSGQVHYTYFFQIDQVYEIVFKNSMKSIVSALEEFEERKEKFIKEIETLRSCIKEKNEEVINLREKLTECISEKEERNQDDKKIKSLQSELKHATDNLNIQKREYKNLDSHVKSCQTNLETVKKECDSLNYALKDAIYEKNVLRDNFEENLCVLKSTNEVIENLTDKYSQLKKYYEDSKIIIDNMGPRLQKLQDNNQNLRNEIEEKNQIINKYKSNINILAKQNTTVVKLNSPEIHRLKCEIESRDIIINELRETISELKNKISKLKDSKNILMQELDQSNQLSELLEEISTLGKNKEKLQGDMKTLKVHLTKYQSKNKKLEYDVGCITRENEKITLEITYLKNVIEELSINLPTKSSMTKINLQDISAFIAMWKERCQAQMKNYRRKTVEKYEKSTQLDIIDYKPVNNINVDYDTKSEIHNNDANEKILQERIKQLQEENCKIINELKIKENHFYKSTECMREQYQLKLKDIHENHNDSIKRLQTQYDEMTKYSETPFDVEKWLREMNPREITNLHQRVLVYVNHLKINDDMEEMATRDITDVEQYKKQIIKLKQKLIEQTKSTEMRVELEKKIVDLQKHLCLYKKQFNCSLSNHEYHMGSYSINRKSYHHSDVGESDRTHHCMQSSRSLLSQIEMNRHSAKDKSFDSQRMNFIRLCSKLQKHRNSN